MPLAVVRRHWPAAVCLLAPLALALALYAPTLRLPYFWDDFPLFNFAYSNNYARLWTDVTGLPYYRPITFTLYKLIWDLLPPGATLWPRLALLGLHGANALLTGWLVGAFWERAGGRASRQPWVALLGALTFAAYPFGALPVAHLAAVHHPAVTMFTLGGAAASVAYARSGRRRWLAWAGVCALLAPYNVEGGVAAGALMALTWLTYDRASAWRQKAALAALPLLSALFLPVWALVPKTRPEVGGLPVQLLHPDTVLASAAFFFQALTYPVQPAAHFLLEQFGGWDLGVILGVGGLALLPAAFRLWRRGLGGLVGLALGWTLLASTPAALILPFDYIVISPRLLYFPGVGGVLLWSALLAVLVVDPPVTLWRLWPRRALTVLLWVAALAIPAGYVMRQARLHVLALAPLAQLNAVARAQPEERHLVVNITNWLAYQQKWYPLGTDGVAVLAPYLNTLDLVYINTGQHLNAEVATFPDLRPTLRWHYLSTANEGAGEMWDAAVFTARAPAYDHVWLTTYTEQEAVLEEVGQVRLGRPGRPKHYLADFDGRVYLTSADMVMRGQTLTLRLEWQIAQADLRPDANVFSHGVDCAGTLLGNGTGRPLGGMLDFTSLSAGARIYDVRRIPLATLPQDGCLQAQVGLFLGDGSRVTVHDAGGANLPEQAYPVRR